MRMMHWCKNLSLEILTPWVNKLISRSLILLSKFLLNDIWPLTFWMFSSCLIPSQGFNKSMTSQLCPIAFFWYKKEDEKGALERLKYAIKILPNSKHIFRNKLRKKFRGSLKIVTLLLLDLMLFGI